VNYISPVAPPSIESSRFCQTLALAALAIVFLSGCGGKTSSKTVSGTVSYQNKAVTSGLINFLPQHGRPLGGAIESDGTYSVSLPPGEYTVRIDAPVPYPEGYKEGQPLPHLGPPLVPEKYANFNSSGLTAKIEEQGSSQQVDFKLP
jgi:hypothetical protein